MAYLPNIVYRGLTNSNYSVNPGQTFVRTEMESGMTRQRRISTSVPSKATVEFSLSREAFAVFQAWYHYKLYDGASWFTMPLFNGKGREDCSCRFTEPYQSSLVTKDWYTVSCNLEVRETPLMSESEIDEVLANE